MSNKFKILFLGDVVGRAGRNIAKQYLLKNGKKYDFVIANCENASHGFGLTQKNYNELLEIGINCLTSGNHIWDKKDIYSYIETANELVRPLNYGKTAQGQGYKIYNDKIVVVNFLGRTFMAPLHSPFEVLEELKEKIGFDDKIVIVDFHAEATAEKICFGKYAADLGVCAVLGTHTHIQTADEKILNDKCAYITDAGFCGAADGVIGMNYEGSLRHFLTLIPERFEVIEKPEKLQINAVEITFDLKNNKAEKITRINEIFEGIKDEG